MIRGRCAPAARHGIINEMIFLREKAAPPPTRIVIDAGPSVIKAFCFETQGPHAMPKPVATYAWDVPSSCPPIRAHALLRQALYETLRTTRQRPGQILVGLGPGTAECRFEQWDMAPAPGRVSTRDDIRALWRDTLIQRSNSRRIALIATPMAVTVNGYPLTQNRNGSDDKAPLGPLISSVSFRALTLSMPQESMDILNNIRRDLGGVSIKYIPLLATECEALTDILGANEGLFIDAGPDHTAVAWMRDGSLLRAGFAPYGAQEFAKRSAGAGRISSTEAHRAIFSRARYADHGAKPDDISRAAAEWKHSWMRTLASFYPAGSAPKRVYIAGSLTRLPEVRTAVQAPDWLGGLSHHTVPALVPLMGSSFFNGYSLVGHLAGPEDVGLAALVRWAINPQGRDLF